MTCVALTGGTGFVGSHLLTGLLADGHAVRALTRRPSAALDRPGVVPVPGALADGASLERLVAGAGTVIHVAGLIQAPSRAAFRAANAEASGALAAAARAAGCKHFVLVSSLAAREPDISPYAESKALGEAMVREAAGPMPVAIVRPPAVWGPGDRATLPLLQGLARGWLLAPGPAAARFSLIHVTDLAHLLRRLAATEAALPTTALEPDDGRAGGYGWRDLARLAEPVVGRKVRVVPVRRALLALVAGIGERLAGLTGKPPLLTRDKVAELVHPDWVCRPAAMLPGWRPGIDFAGGLPATLAWYRAAGWL